jgi:hypothetical protein
VGNRDGCSIRAGALAERQDGGKHLPAVVVRPFAEGTTIGPVAFGDRSAAGEDDQKPAKVERNDSTHRKEEKHEPTPHRLTVTPRAYATLPASLSGGTICRSPPSNKVVQRTAILIGIAFVLGLLGCEGGDEATSVERDTTTVFGVTTGTPDPTVLTREERVSHWIRSCEVRRSCSRTTTWPTSASAMEKDGVSRSAMRQPPTRSLQRRPSNLARTSRSSSRSSSPPPPSKASRHRLLRLRGHDEPDPSCKGRVEVKGGAQAVDVCGNQCRRCGHEPSRSGRRVA